MQANRRDVYEEFQRKKTDPIQQERKREAEKLLAKQVLYFNINFIDIFDHQSIIYDDVGSTRKRRKLRKETILELFCRVCREMGKKARKEN